jgi:hypothetical protein
LWQNLNGSMFVGEPDHHEFMHSPTLFASRNLDQHRVSR